MKPPGLAVEGVRQEIPGEYVRKNTDQIGVHVGAYDVTRPLVIDPVLTYSTSLGGSGSGSEGSNAIAIDLAGNAYVTGSTASATVHRPPTSDPPSLYRDVSRCRERTHCAQQRCRPYGSTVTVAVSLSLVCLTSCASRKP